MTREADMGSRETRPAALGAFLPESSRWLAGLSATGKSPRTVEAYGSDLFHLAQAITLLGLGPAAASALVSFGQTQVDELVYLWREQGAAIGTILRRFSAIRGFAKYLSERGIDCSRLLWTKLPPIDRHPRRPVTDEFVSILIEAPETADWIELRNRAVVALQASAGLTTSEIVALDQRHVLSEGMILVEQTHLMSRIVTASRDAKSLLRRYLDASPAHGKDTPLFVNSRGRRLSARSVQLAFRRLGGELGLPISRGPMCLRHWRGQALARKGATQFDVACALGISISAAARYFASDMSEP